ncbi:hypothetical protein LLE49_04095 [Alicyclobacillus tolerans]|uniref:hypothetical protein n=1 Tax=Alicyclobacillus tolerans TaxID=90970 RepID=UPI001F297445|nr:hypothetical protein [Alicyclobacillus tolerans]MCF8563917.1 hypothetical protein [Alicyclobacillus tolerans]
MDIQVKYTFLGRDGKPHAMGIGQLESGELQNKELQGERIQTQTEKIREERMQTEEVQNLGSRAQLSRQLAAWSQATRELAIRHVLAQNLGTESSNLAQILFTAPPSPSSGCPSSDRRNSGV